jgi:chemotaxis protein CheD
VGICLYDSASKVAGLSHIMLPDSTMSPNDHNIMKFADTAVPELIRQMERRGAIAARMKAKIAGGAQMFEVKNNAQNATWQIGQRNVAAVTQALQKARIAIIARDVLENYGRTVSFDPTTGLMTVRALNKTIKEL